jgi:tetratricopeptide (TPR) repeat protein
MRLPPLLLAASICAAAAAFGPAPADAAPLPDAASAASERADRHAMLLRAVGDESAMVRERAAAALEAADGLTAAEIGAALAAAPGRAVPGLVRVAAARGFTDLAPRIAEIAAGRDAVAAEAALRSLVRLGRAPIDAGLRELSKPGAVAADARRTRLRCLEAQRRVEREIVSRWRRKGGSYRGRFTAIEKEGPEVQVVLVAMLLDIPLEDQFVAGAMSDHPALRKLAVERLADSQRRGYQTFEPLPPTIEANSLFSFATQALADVADLATVGDVLRNIHDDLIEVDIATTRVRFNARPLERRSAEDVAWVLSSRGDPERLEGHLRRAESLADSLRAQLRMRAATPETNADGFQDYCYRLSEVAGFLHQLGRYDDAVARWAEIVAARTRIMGKEPATDNYNLACALARAGRTAEAVEALARALDPEVSTGFDDLTREWVTEDGDLASLRDEPGFIAAVKKRFGR